MHIVLANRWYPPYTGYGGVAMYDYYLAHALVALGHRVTILAARWSQEIPECEDDQGVTVRRIYFPDRNRLNRLPLVGRYARPFLQWLYSRDVAKALKLLDKADPFDVVEFAEVNAEGWAYLHQRVRRPVVVRCHTPTFVLRDHYTPAEMPYDTVWTTRMEQDCIRRADALTAPSQDMARTVSERMGFSVERFTVIPNPLNVQAFAVERQQKSPEEEIVVLHVGRLDRVKGVEVLAQAIPSIVQQYPNVRFVYVGDDRPTGQGDTWRQRLTAGFVQAGVDSHVTFTGPVDHAGLLDWYRRADIAVVPSLVYESFSYTVAQAMAAGLAVIATRSGGIPETLGNSGLLVPQGDPQALQAALVGLVTTPESRVRLQRQAISRIQAFDAQWIAGSSNNQYKQLMAC